MNKLILTLAVSIICFNSMAQNIGQVGDTLKNYADINGLKQGLWQKHHENGSLLYETYFIDGKPVGDYKRYDDGGYLTVHMVYDTATTFARAKFLYPNGKPAAVGNYRDRNKDSIWNYYNNSGILYLQESYKNGVNDGTFRNFTSEKICLEELNWKDGVKEGSWKKFFTNGQIMWEANYVNGKLVGEAKAYFKSGKIYKEGVFKNDLMEGSWKKYTENGNLEKIYNYDNGISPEADSENDEMMRDLYKNKDQIHGPRNSNDIDWLKGSVR